MTVSPTARCAAFTVRVRDDEDVVALDDVEVRMWDALEEDDPLLAITTVRPAAIAITVASAIRRAR